MTSGVDALLGALPRGLNRGSDTRAVVVTTVEDYDVVSGRVLTAVGGDPSWLLAIEATYSPGDLIAVLRNPWTGRPELVLGPLPSGAMTVPALPAAARRETVTRTEGSVRITHTRAKEGEPDGH